MSKPQRQAAIEDPHKAGGDVQSTADALATVMDDFGRTLSSGSGQMPDAAAFTNASVKMTEACK